MLLFRPRLTAEGLVIAVDGRQEMTVARPTGDPRPVSVFGRPLAAVAAPAADRWLSEVLDRAAHLVHLADPWSRKPEPRFSEPDDRVSFADGFPVLIAAESSLAELNGWLAQGPNADQAPMPMIRFRPNLVVAGTEPWAEDGWRRVRIGAAEFRAVKGCDRCVMTTIDPDTAARGKEPIATLARHRRFDRATWFGMNLIPDTPGTSIRVGDDVEILEAVPAPDGPPR
jgi:uncharacterized protein YcbX